MNEISAETIGYLASVLVFATFSMKTMMPLRLAAMASNVAFVIYGYVGGIVPIFILHVGLLPLNAWRLHQGMQLVRRVRRATNGDLSFDSLMPHASCHRFEAGATLFRKGDSASELFLITAGTVRLVELNVEVSEGCVIGEIGVFSPQKTRMATAVAVTRVDVMTIAEDRVIAICNDNSDFGFYLLSLITKRMVANFESLERRVTGTR
jgi:hypothetical protein